MATETNQGTTLPPAEEFDTVSLKGWDRFVKFLAGNVIMTIAALVVVALLTVWS